MEKTVRKKARLRTKSTTEPSTYHSAQPGLPIGRGGSSIEKPNLCLVQPDTFYTNIAKLY